MTLKLDQLDFKSLQRVHIIGVCGTLMGAFAAFLKRRGLQVTGSDQNIYPPMSDVLKEAGVELFNGYRRENLGVAENRPDLVVIGNVIRADNPEAVAAIDGGYVYASLPEAMEQLFLVPTCNLVVAGTHGKTTTSSLLTHVLRTCKLNPSYFIGGVSHDLPVSFHIDETIHSTRGLFVLEGDEYDTAFWDKVPKFNHYRPDQVILTSVEYDHADIYPDFAAVQKAFEGLLQRIRPGGKLIGCFDYESVRRLCETSKVQVVSYGLGVQKDLLPRPRFTPGNIRMDGETTRFDVLDDAKKVGEVRLQIPGNHNILNALAVWIQAQVLGLAESEISAAMASFRGVKRRQEVRGEVDGILVIDDFAHHPTAVRETLRALRSRYPGRRLVTAFEPRSATSRRKIFQRDYAGALGEASLIYIAAPFDQSRIAVEDQFSSQTLAEDLQRAGRQAHVFTTVDEGILAVTRNVRPGDLVAVLSNGGFGGFINKLLDKLREPKNG
jgi:UDP-N-acetylmuramate: L-alanyl-gamma-D-glutamyl-meso-diaminopimelate ligase